MSNFLCLIVLITEARLQKSLKVYTDNIPAAKAWRDVGKHLGLAPEDLEEIGGPASDKKSATTKQTDHEQAREEARKMLEKWMETAGDNASVDQLLSTVQKLKLNDVAGMCDSNLLREYYHMIHRMAQKSKSSTFNQILTDVLKFQLPVFGLGSSRRIMF